MAKKRKATGTLGGEDAKALLRAYLEEVRVVRSSGSAVKETSYYPALQKLFDAVGSSLNPKVRCISHTRKSGSGLPDFGLFTQSQLRKAPDDPFTGGVAPERGVIEAKGPSDKATSVADSVQVRGYLRDFGLVILTNLREFMIVERAADGSPHRRESFALAADEASFWRDAVGHPQETAEGLGEQFVEFLKRACLHSVPLTDPRDVAAFLASYAKDALARVERQKELPALQSVRSALEEALSMKFDEAEGEHFFRSTLVQTLFYGIFSAWAAWRQQRPGDDDRFDWRSAEWTLHVPFVRALYEEVSKPTRLRPLGLEEPLDWAAATLNRVVAEEFFARFQAEHAVQYFYEPFLEAYDPELRKQFGVWYTPPEIVKYQVARVDRALREELGLPEGLADPNVIVLDPCCGTGAYLVETLDKIAETLRDRGGDALVASDLKHAAMTRVFGFEIMPAPFVIAHLQIALALRSAGAPLAYASEERVGVYLTNALTGWEPPKGAKATPALQELADEREAADEIKRERRVLVVIGNPPYNAYAGASPGEEHGLVEPYKGIYFVEKLSKRGKNIEVRRYKLNDPPSIGGWGIRKFNLDDLYVRFFRLAERRIAEISGRGVVSFISNHSWLSDPSFVILRERLLNSFDDFWVENLHGNRKISEYGPDGRTSETVFAIRGFSVGIKQGVATSLWVKSGKRGGSPAVVRYRDDIDDSKAEQRRARLLGTLAEADVESMYQLATPTHTNRYSFRPHDEGEEYAGWPRLTDLGVLTPLNGLMEKRAGALIDIQREPLERRMRRYFDPSLSWDDYRQLESALTSDAARFDAKTARKKGIAEGFRPENVRRYQVRPFDTRWCYFTSIRPIWNEPRPALAKQFRSANRFVLSRPAGAASPEGAPIAFTTCIPDNDFQRGHAYAFPLQNLADDGPTLFGHAAPNLSVASQDYLRSLNPDCDFEQAGDWIWLHVLAVGYSPLYLRENASGLRTDWPRIPLPQKLDELQQSAVLGERIAEALDTERPVPGVTTGQVAPALKAIARISASDGGQLDPSIGDLAVVAGWGHRGNDGVTMPSTGKIVVRTYDQEELAAFEAEATARGTSLEQVKESLGERTCDVYLNDRAYWRNVPENVWNYYIGGYQVLKKWLSYREQPILGRALTKDETLEAMSIARRIAAILLLQPELDENYRRTRDHAFDWGSLSRSPAES